MQIRLIVNPTAGAGDAQKLLPKVTSALKNARISAEICPTQGPADATKLVREAARAEVDGIAVIGGDGTFSEAVNGFFERDGTRVPGKTWLSLLSAGTGGDFRKTLQLARDPEAWAASIARGTTRAIDCGWLAFTDHDGKPAARAFVNIASFGMGGVVDRFVNESPKWMGGKVAFFWASLRAMVSYTQPPVRLSFDDGPFRETQVVNIAVANGQFFGGGMHIAPQADLSDGYFDVVGLEGLSRGAQLAITPSLYQGTLIGKDGVTFTRAKKITAEPASATAVLLDVDGEAPGRLPATFTIREGAILLRC